MFLLPKHRILSTDKRLLHNIEVILQNYAVVFYHDHFLFILVFQISVLIKFTKLVLACMFDLIHCKI